MSSFNYEINKDKNPSAEDLRFADYYYKMALDYYNMKRYKEANTYFLNASEHYEKYVLENPEYVSYEFAYCCQRIGRFYMDSKSLKESIKYFNRAIELYEVLLKDNPEDIAINRDLSQSYDDIADILRKVHDIETAKKYIMNSIEIRKRLVEERNLKEFRFDLAVSYRDIALIKKSTDKKEAEKYFIASMLIRKQLAEENPDKYTLNLSYIYTSLARFYEENGSDKANKYYLSAIYLCEQLAEKNYEYYCDDLADAYYSYSIYCMESKKDYVQAEQLALYAQKIYERLAEEKTVKRLHYLVLCLGHLGRLYNKTNQNKKSEEYLLRALDIEKRNFGSNPLYCGDTLINIFACIIELYYKINDIEKVEEYTLLKIDYLKQLDKLNHSVYTQQIIDEYCWLLDYFNNRDDFENLEKHSFSYIEYLKEESNENLDKKSLLARNYMLLGTLYTRWDKSDLAKECYITSINIYKEVTEVNISTDDLEGLAKAYSMLGTEYSLRESEIDCNDDEKIKNVEECFLASVKLRESIAKRDDDWHNKDELGRLYNDVGVFYYRFYFDDKTETTRKYYQKSIETLAEVADKNPKDIYPNLAFAYGNLGLTYHNDTDYDMTIAKECFLSSINLLKEVIKMGDTSYNSLLAEKYESMIDVCQKKGDIDDVEKYSTLLSELNEDMED